MSFDWLSNLKECNIFTAFDFDLGRIYEHNLPQMNSKNKCFFKSIRVWLLKACTLTQSFLRIWAYEFDFFNIKFYLLYQTFLYWRPLWIYITNNIHFWNFIRNLPTIIEIVKVDVFFRKINENKYKNETEKKNDNFLTIFYLHFLLDQFVFLFYFW